MRGELEASFPLFLLILLLISPALHTEFLKRPAITVQHGTANVAVSCKQACDGGGARLRGNPLSNLLVPWKQVISTNKVNG